MTYVLGLCQQDVAAIISDNRASTGGFSGSNTVLKSGILFPGCIYGASGHAGEANRFIKACKRDLDDTQVNEDGWRRFWSFACGFAFDNRSPFDLILASRHFGSPGLYHFRSSIPSLNQVGDGFATGSGCRLLNDSFRRIHSLKGPSVSERATKLYGLPPEDYPYFYCLLLMERVKGTEVSALEQAGVGGYFHFFYQTKGGEWAQRPAVYLIHSCRHNHLWVYRLAMEGPALVIHDGDLPRPAVLVNAEDWDGLSTMDEEDISKFGSELVSRSTAGPGYYFCGLGFSEPEFRGKNLISLWREGREIFSPSSGGKVSESVDELIKRACSKNIALDTI